MGAHETTGKIRLLDRTEMVHYLDVRGGWDLKECDCCFERAVGLGIERAVTMPSLASAHSMSQLPASTPLAPHRDRGNGTGFTGSVLEYVLRVQAFGEQGKLEPHAHFSCKCALAPFLCAEVMILEWMAEPRVGVLMDLGRIRSRLPAVLANEGSLGWPRIDTLWKAHMDIYAAVYPVLAGQLEVGKQEERDIAASVLVQVLGVKESADLQEGFGFFVQHVLSGGLEKVHSEGRGRGGAGGKGPTSVGLMRPTERMWQTGIMGKVGPAVGAMMQSLQSGSCVGPEDWLRIIEKSGMNPSDIEEMLRAGAMDMAVPFGIGGGGGSGKEGVGGGDLKEHRKLGAMFFAPFKGATSSNVHDAAIQEAMLRKRKLTSGKLEKRVNNGAATGGGVEEAASAAPAKGQPAPSAAALSAGVGLYEDSSGSAGISETSHSSSSSSSSFLSSSLVPVITDPVVGLLTYQATGKGPAHAPPTSESSKPAGQFGATLPPHDASTRLLEWEEWSQGDEAAVNFPEDSSARCFGLGRTDGGNVAAQQGSFQEAPTKQVPLLHSRESGPIVRCRADANLIVEFAGSFLDAPACAHCNHCIRTYISHVPFVAFVANFAYRPVTVLLDRFLSVFKPHTEVFQNLLIRLCLDSSSNAPHNSVSGKRVSSVRMLRERAEQLPVAFLLSLALLCAKPLLQQSKTQGGQSPKAGGGSSGAKGMAGERRVRRGDFGEGREGKNSGGGEGDGGLVLEEVQSSFTVAMLPGSVCGGGGEACSGRHATEEDGWAWSF
ncbi:unnamed protein product [Closterium sp. Yama58-4]|nr:unnamed protein product [Closterium sp. Yama58-4]